MVSFPVSSTVMRPRGHLRAMQRGALIGLCLGGLVAACLGVWFAFERGEGREAIALFAAALSLPLSQLIAVSIPASGEVRYWLPFILLVPPLNAFVVGAVFGGVMSLIKRRAPARPASL